MKRNTDLSRLRPATVPESAETVPRPSSCAAALDRATLLLAGSMRESDIPVAQLSSALARMAQTLSGIGTPLFGPADTEAAAHLQTLRDAFARDIAVCIESLQFHDRLIQQLTQARDILAGLAANRVLAGVPNGPAKEGGTEGSIELF